MTGRGAARAAAPVLVVGFGNPLRGDDGIGVRVIEALLARGLPAGVEALEGGSGGLDLVTLLEGRQRVILVDAAEIGRQPGEWTRIESDALRLQDGDGTLSPHAAGVREGLLLARVLGRMPEEVVIFGIQPACLEWREGLSPQVEAALPAVVEEVLAEAVR